MRDWLVIDEDCDKVIACIYGTYEEAKEQLEQMKEARSPALNEYWHTWTLYRRAE